MPASGDHAECRALLANGSRSFYAASFLLPSRVRAPAAALYAFCRIADDIVDASGADADVVSDLHARVRDAYDGRPRAAPYDRAFAEVVAAYGVPLELPNALIEGFAWDMAQRRYETIDDLLDYAARVAGTVGAMMCLLMGNRDSRTLARAIDLGMAMQLTNIARDVGEDARAGRLYLPLAWCREEGVDIAQIIKRPQYTPEIGRVVDRVLSFADTLYQRADAGIAELPADCRAGIRAARYLYAEIGHEVMRRGRDSVSTRAVVAKRRKLALLARSVTAKFAGSPMAESAYEAHAASQFLISAVERSPLQAPRNATAVQLPPWWDLRGQAMHVLDLFEKLERRERAARPRNGPAYGAYQSAAQSG
ncbi:MAG: phytoene/squalene synthase family protein [Hyphomicrobium sp.]